MGAAAVGIGIIGAGLLGHAASSYGDLESGCGLTRVCNPGEVDKVEARAIGGYVMLGLAGALAIVDVALIVVTARRR